MTLKDFRILEQRYPGFAILVETAVETAIAACNITTDFYYTGEDEIIPPYTRVRLSAYRIVYRKFFAAKKTDRQKRISHKSAEILWSEPFEKKVRKPKKAELFSIKT